MNTNQDSGMETPAAKSETLPTRQARLDEWREREKDGETWIESNEGNRVWRQITAAVPDEHALGWTALVEEHNDVLQRLSHCDDATTDPTLTQNK